MKKALFITYQFPPISGAASQRHLRFINKLNNFSWEPVVLTVDSKCITEYYSIDSSLLTSDVYKILRIYAKSFNPMEYVLTLKKKYHNNVSFTSSINPDIYDGSKPRKINKIQIFKDFIVSLFRIPDMMNGWIFFAFLKGLLAFRRYKYQVIYASGGPWSSLLVGYLLSSFMGTPLICDFRDPWIRNPYRTKKSRQIEKLETFLEKIVVKKASYVIANTERLLSDFREHYRSQPSDKFVHISNGFDQSQFGAILSIKSGQNTKIVVRHVGSLYGPRAPVFLLQAVSQLKKTGILSESNFSLEFIGKVNNACLSQDSLKKFEIEDLVKMIPPVTHAEAIQAIQSSDALLIVQPDTALQIPGKLFEYIAASKPVIALACPGATADLVKVEKLGMVADPEDINGIKKIIIQLLEDKKNNTLSSVFGCEDPMKFESNNLTCKLTELFNRAINDYE